jgi:hypothetical protein
MNIMVRCEHEVKIECIVDPNLSGIYFGGEMLSYPNLKPGKLAVG